MKRTYALLMILMLTVAPITTAAPGFQSSKDDFSAMEKAIRMVDVEAVQALLSASFNPNTKSEGEDPWTPIMDAISRKGIWPYTERGKLDLHDVISEKQLRIIEILLDSGAEVNYQTKSGVSPLTMAAYFGDLDTTNLLLSRGANINAKTNFDDGRTALMLAAAYNYVEIVQTLLWWGANLDERNSAGATALMFAANEAAIALLSKDADVNARDNHGYTALMGAVASGRTPKILTLLFNKADINAKAKDGATALKIAENKRLESITLLLKQYGAKE